MIPNPRGGWKGPKKEKKKKKGIIRIYDENKILIKNINSFNFVYLNAFICDVGMM